MLVTSMAVLGLWGCADEPDTVSEVVSVDASSEQNDAVSENEEEKVISFIGVGDNLIMIPFSGMPSLRTALMISSSSTRTWRRILKKPTSLF